MVNHKQSLLRAKNSDILPNLQSLKQDKRFICQPFFAKYKVRELVCTGLSTLLY